MQILRVIEAYCVSKHRQTITNSGTGFAHYFTAATCTLFFAFSNTDMKYIFTPNPVNCFEIQLADFNTKESFLFWDNRRKTISNVNLFYRIVHVALLKNASKYTSQKLTS